MARQINPLRTLTPYLLKIHLIQNFSFKTQPYYNIISKLWSHQYNRTYFFVLVSATKNSQNSFATDAENVHHILEDEHQHFCICVRVSCDVAKCFCVNAENSLFTIMLQFLQASCDTGDFLETSPQKEVW
jgi:hypothetical protein